MPRESLELPPAVARAFVRDMKASFACGGVFFLDAGCPVLASEIATADRPSRILSD